jgi:hypothetical protein
MQREGLEGLGCRPSPYKRHAVSILAAASCPNSLVVISRIMPPGSRSEILLLWPKNVLVFGEFEWLSP